MQNTTHQSVVALSINGTNIGAIVHHFKEQTIGIPGLFGPSYRLHHP